MALDALVQADNGLEAALDADHLVRREASQRSFDEPLSIERSGLLGHDLTGLLEGVAPRDRHVQRLLRSSHLRRERQHYDGRLALRRSGKRFVVAAGARGSRNFAQEALSFEALQVVDDGVPLFARIGT